ncbi:MAG: phosphopentomutase [Endomicrobia bacterium]|nr:phosphopentomutase [Endomicrobiia bacterium]MCL2507083.1 phosphopentomutase [Endomicrobiia bacterium]
MLKRIVLIVLDSAGVGELPDAEKYGDKGANTIGHILDSMPPDFSLPNLEKLGLYKILNRETKFSDEDIIGCYGKSATQSPAKDTTAGHWEMAGIILNKPFPVYPNGFPSEIIEEFEKLIGIKTIGNVAASGTEIIKELGEQHQKTGYPIVYTSADSVFQIAAHEKTFGLEKLYEICETARDMLKGDNAVGRVIARPFTGTPGNYIRTANRKDYALNPPDITILDEIKNSGGDVIGVGKIEDIFNGIGLTEVIHTKGNLNGIEITLSEINKSICKKTLLFTNLVDFDMLWGHRRDVASYAKALKEFDNFLPEILNSLTENDMLIITADHGCDPTYKAHTDHTREYTPLLVYGKILKKGVDLGVRESMADIAATIADIFSLPAMKNGKSFKRQITINK